MVAKTMKKYSKTLKKLKNVPRPKFFWAPKHLKPNNDFEEAHVFTCFCRKYVYIARQIPQIHIFQISMFIFPLKKIPDQVSKFSYIRGPA